MEPEWLLLAGGVSFLLASWAAELLGARRQPHLFLSRDERVASLMTDSLQRAYVDGNLGRLGRLEILRRVSWIWKSGRVVALQSGRWSAIPWLLLFLAACLLIALKTLPLPRSRDLRLLLGGREFLCFLVSDKPDSQ